MVRNVRVFAVGCFIAVMLGVLAVSGSPAHAAVSITRGSASADLGQESPISVQVTSSVGSLQVALTPPEAVTAGAHWRRAGTVPWLASGATEAGLATGTCTVEFEPVAGWTAPSNQDLPILAGQTAVTTGSYVFIPTTGDLQVMLAPPEAVAAGAQWRRVGTVPWLASGDTESGLVPGTYTVEFQAVTDWVAPANQNVPILAGQTTPTTGTYLLAPATGGLQVTLAPPEAIVAGAKWRRMGTVPWLASGTTELGLVAGTYTVEFQAVTGWIAPADQNAAIVAGQTTAVTGTYTSLVEDPGALQVSLTPAAAVAAGAQWRRAGTTVWLDSGTTETGVATGECTVEFQPVPGWLTPDDASAQIVSRQTASASGNYEAYASGVLADYKVSYKKCDMEQVDPSGLAVTAGLGGGATLKIQRLKELPANTDDVPGKYLYLLDCAGVERVDVDGGLASFYTDAPIGALVANDSVGSIASKNACVARIEVAVTLGSVRMVAVPGGTNTGLPVTRIASGGSADKMLAIGLTGIVLEDLVTGQSVKSLSVTTKGFRDKVTGALVVATAGVGRIAPAAAADTSGTYALVAPRFGSIASTGAIMRPDELVSEGPVGRITGKSLYLGGALRPAILGWEDEPQRMLMKAESFVRISANHGVHGRFWAGFDAQGPTYTGTVGTVATTSGTLSGELRVAPGTVVKFRPDQGTIDVFTSN